MTSIIRRATASIGRTLAADELAQGAPTWGSIDFVEALAEDLMGDGRIPVGTISLLQDRLPLAIRSGGLGIGAEPDAVYLARLAAACDRHAPFLVSEQLAWSSHAAVGSAALVPPALTEATLARTCRDVFAARLRLGRRLALESPVQCQPVPANAMAPGAFLHEIVERTGCRLSLDLRHAWLWARVLGQDPLAHLVGYPIGHIAAIRVPAHGDAGPTCALGGRTDARMLEAIWGLFAWVVQTAGPLPVVLEWQGARPGADVVTAEVNRAAAIVREAAGEVDDALES